jgi:hypothetical protein
MELDHHKLLQISHQVDQFSASKDSKQNREAAVVRVTLLNKSAAATAVQQAEEAKTTSLKNSRVWNLQLHGELGNGY